MSPCWTYDGRVVKCWTLCGTGLGTIKPGRSRPQLLREMGHQFDPGGWSHATEQSQTSQQLDVTNPGRVKLQIFLTQFALYTLSSGLSQTSTNVL